MVGPSRWLLLVFQSSHGMNSIIVSFMIAEHSRCFYTRWVTSGDLTQPSFNQTNSGGLAKALHCDVCKTRLLSWAAFKGHIFSLLWCLQAPCRALRIFITNLQLKRAEPEQPHFPLRTVKTQRGISGGACCVCTPRNSVVCWNEIQYSQFPSILKENNEWETCLPSWTGCNF